MSAKLIEASVDDVGTIVDFLSAMQNELNEFSFDSELCRQSITKSFDEHVHWFLFLDEHENKFGTCHLQSVHSYWRLDKRYYLGAFYISPTHRKLGHFKTINSELKNWVVDKGGIQIYCHIHKDNEKSLKTFSSVGIDPVEYVLCANHWGD